MKALVKGWKIIRFLYDNKVITLNGEKQIILEDDSIVSPKEGEEIVDVISEPANPEGKGYIFPYPNGKETPAFVMESIDEYDYKGKPIPSFEVYRYCVDPFVYEIYGEETYNWFTYDSLHDRAMEV